jgi:uncharacterized protein YfaS (alpha-2-macroglobulin family)
VDCDKVLKLKTDNVFTKWALYKATVTSIFPDERTRRNLTLEDYLPGTFRVINSGFRTESASITWASTDWRWTYLEYRPDVVMGNSAYAWSKENTLEYYFRPEFEWTYLQPPVVGYLMYNPEIRASGTFREVEVK